MGQPKLALAVKLFTAVTFNNEKVFEKAKSILVENFGIVDTLSAICDFTYTQYYAREMGDNLKKQFLGFEKLVRPENLPDIKLMTNKIEGHFSQEKKKKFKF